MKQKIMKEKILSVTKCQYCGKFHEWIIRDKKTNTSLSDEDIQDIISISRKPPHYEYKYCNKCDIPTLQLYVAFKGVI